MAETPEHRDNIADSIAVLRYWFRDDPMVYVSGNMFIYYVPGDRHRHVAPDVFVVHGIPRDKRRRRYLLWEEGKGPDAVIEITSASTREEDLDDKLRLYRDILKVREYFLFDPFGEYLSPPLRGFRLKKGRYERIRPLKGRLPSKVLRLHLEQADWRLRFYDPSTLRHVPTPQERADQEQEARRAAEAEVLRLRIELERFKRERS